MLKEWPRLPDDFKVSEEILAFQIKDWKEPSIEELKSNPKLAHLLGSSDNLQPKGVIKDSGSSPE